MRISRILFFITLVLSTILLIGKSPVLAIAGQWSASGSTIYYTDGNLGVGTSSPLATLHVSTPNSDYNRLVLGREAATLDLLGYRYDSNNSIQYISANAYNDGIWNRREAGFDSWTIRQQVTPNNSGTFNIVHGDAGSGTTISSLKNYFTLTAGGDASFSRGGTGSTLTIQTPSTDVRLNTGTKNLTIPEGNVGIGTVNPTRKLSVNGTILAKEIIVTNSSSYWPDYVFDDTYKLMPLKELAEFIDKNGHLPNLPSADEISQSGQPLGEIQKQQMEKIEELTLHLIEKDQQIEALNERISKLETFFQSSY